MLEALIAVSATPLPDIDVVVTAPAENSPDAPRNTIVDAPLAEAAVVLALFIVPLVMLEALIAVNATPLPDNEVNVPVVAVTTLAAKLPLESLATIVDAPLAEAAVVLALAIVPADMLEALIAVRATPLPEIDVVVIAFAVKFPLASLATIVDAPLADAAVVLALAMVPLDILLALILVIVAPAPMKFKPDTLPLAVTTPVLEILAAETFPLNEPVTNVPTFPAKLPLESRKTIVDAPLAVAAVVRALAIVPLDILLALILVKPAPLPDTAPDIETNVPTFPAKEPLLSLATMVEAPLALAAVVLALVIVPAEMFEALMLVIVKPAPVKFAALTFPVAVTLPAVE
jgi:hypothetical protein